MIFRIRQVSYGGTAAIVTNMAMLIGLSAAMATKSAIVSALAVVALGDNLTDSLSIHVYQESERLDGPKAFVTTIANFTTRLLLSASFILFVILLPMNTAIAVSGAWAFLLLTGLTYLLARERRQRAFPEIVKHMTVALMVVIASEGIGMWVSRYLG